MAFGTTIPNAKRGLVDLITARLGDTANVAYVKPVDGSGLEAGNGTGAIIYLDDQINSSFAVVVLTAGVLRIDESYTIPVVIQASSLNNEDMEACDGIAAELAHGVLGAVAQNPRLGMSDSDELQVFVAMPESGTQISGAIGDSAEFFGTKFVISVRVTARLILT